MPCPPGPADGPGPTAAAAVALTVRATPPPGPLDGRLAISDVQQAIGTGQQAISNIHNVIHMDDTIHMVNAINTQNNEQSY